MHAESGFFSACLYQVEVCSSEGSGNSQHSEHDSYMPFLTFVVGHGSYADKVCVAFVRSGYQDPLSTA